ncbi:MAG: signal peptide peptidase SppA [Elusimicrobiota bacterium]
MAAAKKLPYAALTVLLLLSVVSGLYLILSEDRVSLPSISRDSKTANKIGVVDVQGEIYFPFSDTGFTPDRGANRVIRTLKKYRENDKIDAVIIRVNSPGGTIGAVQEIVSEVNRVKKSGKPVVASVADIGASGGYYVASQADKIIANEGSIVGSIGVIMASGDFSELLDNLGIKIETIKSGAHKDAGSFHRPLSAPEKEYLQAMVDDAFDQFVVAVSSGRNISIQKVREMSQGQIYTGNQAADMDLIDKLGGFSDAVNVAEELAEIEDAEIIREKHYDISSLLKIFAGGETMMDMLAEEKYSGISYLYSPR